MNFIGGILQRRLTFYPVFCGLIYTIYCYYRNKEVFIDFDKLKKFLVVYLGGICVSLVLGLFNYPYYGLVVNGSIDQIEKLPKVIEIFKSFGIIFDAKHLVIPWMIIRILKGTFFEIIYTFGGAYMIYCWYHDKWKIAFEILLKAIFASLLIIFLYSIIELFYFTGNEQAKHILIIINPYLHIIEADHGWYPPLLLKDQLRSIFSEPSYLGIWASFALPFVWYKLFILDKPIKRIILIFTIIFFCFLIYMTNSRTGVILLCGEQMLLLIYCLVTHKKFIVKNVCIIMLCVLGSFVLSSYFINSFISSKTVTTEAYFESNIGTITNVNARSNGARYSTIYANVMIGLDNPILGIGKGLVPAYMPDYFPNFADNNKEVQNWIKYQKEEGILKSPIPTYCAYSLIFAESGILGLCVFLIPVIILIYYTLKLLYYNPYKYEFIFLSISLLGILASGFSSTLTITYCYWVLLGLGYAMCFGKENDVKDNGNTGSRQEH